MTPDKSPDKTPEEKLQELKEMGLACLLALGAFFLAVMGGMLRLMAPPSSDYYPHSRRAIGDIDDDNNLGGYASTSAGTQICGVCGSTIARGATICPFCQRQPNCR